MAAIPHFTTWLGIGICLFFSAMFSGLTIGLFGLSRLRLEVLAETGHWDARVILKLRKDSHLLLATLLWGNVSVNVLLTILSDSILAGVSAFFFSTVVITIFGEIMPQAFFTRFALSVGALFTPFIWIIRLLLYPVGKPTALLLDAWLGKEGVTYFTEEEFRVLLKKHVQSVTSDISKIEGIGAMNFLALDDLAVKEAGEIIHPDSVLPLPEASAVPVFPKFKKDPEDPFLKQVQVSGKKWVIITDPSKEKPLMVLDADAFLRDALYGDEKFHPYRYCHRPVVVTDPSTKLGQVIRQFAVQAEYGEDDVIDHDLILYWSREKRIITGADLLGRLLRGITRREKA